MGSPTLSTLRLDDLTTSRDRPPSPPSPPSFSAGVRNTPRWAKCPSTVETRCIMIPITVDMIGRCYCRPPRYVLVAGAKAAPSDSGYNLGMQETTQPLDLADIYSSALADLITAVGVGNERIAQRPRQIWSKSWRSQIVVWQQDHRSQWILGHAIVLCTLARLKLGKLILEIRWSLTKIINRNVSCTVLELVRNIPSSLILPQSTLFGARPLSHDELKLYVMPRTP